MTQRVLAGYLDHVSFTKQIQHSEVCQIRFGLGILKTIKEIVGLLQQLTMVVYTPTVVYSIIGFTYCRKEALGPLKKM